MSTPVRGADGPLGYAPRWARGSGRIDTAFDARGRSSTAVQELPDLKPPRVAIPPREAVSAREIVSGRDLVSAQDPVPLQDAAFEPGAEALREPASHRDTKLPGASGAMRISASNSLWKRKKRPAVFEGDTALKELRSRLASAPDQTPEPPLYQTKTPIFAAVARLMGVMVLAAAGALGFLWITAPRGAPPPVASKPDEVALVSYRSFETSQKPPRPADNIVAGRVPDAPSSGSPWAVANYTRDATDGISAPPAGLTPRMPAPPRAPTSRVGAPPSAAPTPAAAPPTPLPAEPAPAAATLPPVAPSPASRAPVPAITAPVLVAPPATPSVATRDRDEVAALLVRARAYLSSGDVAAARLVLRRAADRDDPQAALALGGTYDPAVLKRLGIINFHADPAQAREWYRRAAELGSADASLRLEQLVQTDR